MVRDLLVVAVCFAAVLFNRVASQGAAGGATIGPSGDVDNHFIYPPNSSSTAVNINFTLGDTIPLQWVSNSSQYTVILIQYGEFTRKGPTVYTEVRGQDSINSTGDVPVTLSWIVSIRDLSLSDGAWFFFQVNDPSLFNSHFFNILESGSAYSTFSFPPTFAPSSTPPPSAASLHSSLPSSSSTTSTLPTLLSDPFTTYTLFSTETLGPSTPVSTNLDLPSNASQHISSSPSSPTANSTLDPSPVATLHGNRQDSMGLAPGVKIGMGVGLSTLSIFPIVFAALAIKKLRRKRVDRRRKIHELGNGQVRQARNTNAAGVIPLDELIAENERLRLHHLNERHEMDGEGKIGELEQPPMAPIELPGPEFR